MKNDAPDSTLASASHTQRRRQTEGETVTEPTAEARSQPAKQRRSSNTFSASREQDPRSTAAATNGTQSLRVMDPPLPSSMSYDPSQTVVEAQPSVDLEMQEADGLPDTLSEQQMPQQLEQQQQHQQHQQQQLQLQQLQLQLPQQLQLQTQTPQHTLQHAKALDKLRHASQSRQHSRRLQLQQRKQQQQQQQQQMPQTQMLQAQASSAAADEQQLSPSPRRHLRHQHHHGHTHSEQQQARTRRLEPPVTKATLSELDVSKIIHNPKLRHDINFDPDLHFRPNLDGEKGRRKQEKAQQFWDTLRSELLQFVTDRDAFLATHGSSVADREWSLPMLLNTVKEIIQTLVPARDRELFNEGLNVPLLMQQFERGVADLEKLATWLSTVLKQHCAPMRDDWVDTMNRELRDGNRNNNIDELVRGMCSLLSVLEAMKLDVANHQIRCLRPLLIEDTVHFERRFFCRKIDGGRLAVKDAVNWYEYAKVEFNTPSARHRQALGEMAIFFHGLSQLLLPSVDDRTIPGTFLFDEDHLAKLRADMFDAVHMEICMRIYEALEAEETIQTAAATAAAAEPGSGSNWLHQFTQTPCRESMTGPDFNFNTPPPPSTPSTSPMSSRPASLALSANGSSTTSSPRNSSHPFEATATSAVAPLPHPIDFVKAHQRAKGLYTSLLALLHSTQPGLSCQQRWSLLRPQMAVEIYRTLAAAERPTCPALDFIEQQLEGAMRPGAPIKYNVECTFRDRLLSSLARRVKDYKTMPTIGLFIVAAGGRIHPTSRTTEATTVAAQAVAAAATAAATIISRNTQELDPREDGGIEGMATRLAHLGILHWRVWGHLIYEPQADRAADIVTHPVTV